jgi:glyoxylase-like metal-dependent hydrolase (beta-lactamase superfamily II)
MQSQQYSFQVGAFACFCLLDGYVNYPIQNIYSNVPKDQVEAELLRHALPIDFVTTPYTYLLVKTGQNNVLVDMGAGDFFPTTGGLVQSLHLAGLEPDQIDTVIISHAHPDHIGGMLDERGRPVYPNAHYFLTRDEWSFWFSEAAAARTTPSFISTARKNLEPVKERVEQVEGISEILPGIKIMPAFGHTPGHAVIWVESQNQKLVYVADTVLQPLHLEHPDWLPVYDILPEKAALSKQHIFDLAAAEHSLVLGQHFPPFPSLGYITRLERGWLWEPIRMAEK